MYKVISDFTNDQREARDKCIVMWQNTAPEKRSDVLGGLITDFLADATAFEEKRDVPKPIQPLYFQSFEEADAYQEAVRAWDAMLEWQKDLLFQKALLRTCVPWKGDFSPWFKVGEWAIRSSGAFSVVIVPWEEAVSGKHD